MGLPTLAALGSIVCLALSSLLAPPGIAAPSARHLSGGDEDESRRRLAGRRGGGDEDESRQSP